MESNNLTITDIWSLTNLDSLAMLESFNLCLSLFSLLVVLLRGNHARLTIFTSNH
ncbi:hypothetical protein VAZ01S_013_00720 [Vibrio azureus NBRC 104587]|uniref:Uncharacterized protein n=1 Tax=Vibrio azureus NBRC 104587 TaxID=1219077 RepID=U3ALL4_9VIBR|nr:hypothetical protein VAZ01S_013_00720 [Vibrio azureus NBRC 104587]